MNILQCMYIILCQPLSPTTANVNIAVFHPFSPRCSAIFAIGHIFFHDFMCIVINNQFEFSIRESGRAHFFLHVPNIKANSHTNIDKTISSTEHFGRYLYILWNCNLQMELAIYAWPKPSICRAEEIKMH